MKIGIYGGNVRRGAPLISLIDEIKDMEQRGFASVGMNCEGWIPGLRPG